MIKTPLCDLLGIEVPIVLGGMATGTSAPLVAAVCNAGGLGTLGGMSLMDARQVRENLAAIRDLTERPFGVNFLWFFMQESAFEAVLEARPAVVSFAWAAPDQDLRPPFDRVHEAGLKVFYQATTVPEAIRAADAGADVIVAQGNEGGGHVGWMATLPLVPMVVDAVAPLPVLAAGGIADGRGLAAALALGAQGVLLGTRLLATEESPLHPNFKEAILRSDGHDTILTDITDLAMGRVWPGARARVLRNRLIERWSGREWELRANQPEAATAVAAARNAGDADHAILYVGQDAGLIASVQPVAEVMQAMLAQAEQSLQASVTAATPKP